MFKEKYEESQRQLAEAKEKLSQFQNANENWAKENTTLQQRITFLLAGGDPADIISVSSVPIKSDVAGMPGGMTFHSEVKGVAWEVSDTGMEEIYRYILQRVKDDPAVLAILKAKPTIRVDMVEHTLELNGDTLAGRVALLIHNGFFAEPKTLAQTVEQLKRTGCNQAPPNVLRELKSLTRKGFLVNDDKAYTAVKGMRVEKNGS